MAKAIDAKNYDYYSELALDAHFASRSREDEMQMDQKFGQTQRRWLVANIDGCVAGGTP